MQEELYLQQQTRLLEPPVTDSRAQNCRRDREPELASLRSRAYLVRVR